ncbi:MAG: hypothetical protein ACTFAK_00170 [Candidatus Electronema sp. VV]
MELRTFIHKALTDIIGGVQDAQTTTPTGSVIPYVKSSYESVKTGISEVQSVEFEVVVRVDEKTGSESKLNVVAAFVGGGIKGESGTASGHSASLKFRVPIKFPKKETVQQ